MRSSATATYLKWKWRGTNYKPVFNESDEQYQSRRKRGERLFEEKAVIGRRQEVRPEQKSVAWMKDIVSLCSKPEKQVVSQCP